MTSAHGPKAGKWDHIGPPKKTNNESATFLFFSAHEATSEMAPSDAGMFCPTNRDLADILGRMGFHFHNFLFWGFPFPDSEISKEIRGTRSTP